VFVPHPLDPPQAHARGEFRINPLYIETEPPAADPGEDAQVLFRLRFPSDDYEQEYGACRRYLPEEVAIPRRALRSIAEGRVPDELADLARRRVIVDLPRRYY
jgi:hypothetical protein